MSESENTTFSGNSTLPAEFIHLQLNSYDFYTRKPTSLDTTHGLSLPMHQYQKVPVIRIFGSLPTGHQVLCHIHGVFPYIFIRYDGNQHDQSSVMNQKCTQIHSILEERASVIKRKKYNITKNREKTKLANKLEYIANVSVVKGVPFYGYHIGWSLYYKISFLDPYIMNTFSDTIKEGKLFNKKVETFESHIPYIPQFFADYNLFGCSWIQLNKCYFRNPVLNPMLDLDQILMNDKLQDFLEQFYNNKLKLDSKEFHRISNSLLEIDVLPQFIRNRLELEFIDLHHDFIEKTTEDLNLSQKVYINSTKKFVNEMKETRSALNMPKYEAPKKFSRINDEIQWNATEGLKKMFNEVEANLYRKESKKINFKDFVYNDKRLKNVKKPSEAISEIWPNTPEESQEINSTILHDNILNIPDNDDITFDLPSAEYESNSKKNALIKEGTPNSSDDSSIEVDEDEDEVDVNNSTIISGKFSDNDSIFLLDKLLTQSMTKRRAPAPFFSELDNTKSTKRKKSNKLRRGILFEPNTYVYNKPALPYTSILEELEQQGYPKIDYQDPFFSNPADLGKSPYIYAGKRFEVRSNHLHERLPVQFADTEVYIDSRIKNNYLSTWRYILKPPSYSEVKDLDLNLNSVKAFESQISKNTPITKFLYKFNSDQSALKSKSTIHDKLCHFSLEIHVNSRNNKNPDPVYDEINMIIWKLDEDTYPFDLDISTEGIMVSINMEDSAAFSNKISAAADELPFGLYETETDMIDALIDLVLFFDPDILSGFELHASSWGYIIERCRKVHQIDILEEISRVNSEPKNKVSDKWGYNYTTSIFVTGRHMINIWRALRNELKLTQYTVENISYHVLHSRLPHFSFQDLSNMWSNASIVELRTVIKYWMSRVRNNHLLLKKQEYIDRVTEEARLIGIDFYSVYYRGSQFKVESFLVRLCKSESYILLAPSKESVKAQKPLECIPLVMEPESAFYKSPLLVLDFQSLYPSIMIAYNYCYSTMIGRLLGMKKIGNDIGVTSIDLDDNILTLLKDDLHISPNGIVFAKSSVRKSALAKMLKDILETRVMIKKTMFDIPSIYDSTKKLLNNRQLALKLLANVTYGYASASFSGRMPNSDLSDSIVQTGRETLQQAIDLIEGNDKWGAKVVYGDTDSLFVYLPGKSKDESFAIGKDIAIAVTEQNPDPVVLKFEKVYHPCILVSKKRYVGYSYEFDGQKKPTFDAKGIETVRRDGHPAQQQILEKSLKILFDTKDISKVKSYVLEQFKKIQKGKISIEDFCFAKEVKFGAYKSEKTAPAGALVAIREMEDDQRAQPQFKERVPYVVIKGKQNKVLKERSISPLEFLRDPNSELDSEYYINKTLIPPLERIFNLMGISVHQWISESRRYKKIQNFGLNTKVAKAIHIVECCCCKNSVSLPGKKICKNCFERTFETSSKLLSSLILKQKNFESISTVCRACAYQYTKDAGPVGSDISKKCNSYDCPVFYSKIKCEKYLTAQSYKEQAQSLELLDSW